MSLTFPTFFFCVCGCVCTKANKTLYLLPMKGMFARTNPQLVFLFELLQAHCTYLKATGGIGRYFSEEDFKDVGCSLVFLCVNVGFVSLRWKQNNPKCKGQVHMEKKTAGQHLRTFEKQPMHSVNWWLTVIKQGQNLLRVTSVSHTHCGNSERYILHSIFLSVSDSFYRFTNVDLQPFCSFLGLSVNITAQTQHLFGPDLLSGPLT